MFGKPGWLAAALAALFLAVSGGAALADDDRRHGKWGYGKHYQKHAGHQHHGYKKQGHWHDGKHRKYGHRKKYGYKHGKYYDGKYYGGGYYGHRHDRPYYPKRRKYVYDDGHCRVVVKSGRHGFKKIVTCDRGYRYPGARFIPQSLIHAPSPGLPRAVAQTLDQSGDGQGIVWNEPVYQGSGARAAAPETRYEVTPTKTYREPDGRYCREYRTSATVAGEVQKAYGQACRQPDGNWELVQ